MTAHTETATASRQRDTRWVAPGLALLGTALAVAVVPVMGYGLQVADGAGATERLMEQAGRWQLASMLALFAATALVFAAVRLGRHIGGMAGVVATGAGTAVAFLLGAYYSAFAAGAVAASYSLDNPGPGLGEATLVVVNMVELTRYAPSLLLLAAALVARRSLPRPVTIAACVILVMIFVPFTTWVAALLTPIWLGVAGAVSGPARRGSTVGAWASLR
ncbi:MAG TPA: hypothetical protein VFD59_17575 [Nocardioidaceae bacterium]|nr:hypothetical protein [Nocardioidaceae bacterium]